MYREEKYTPVWNSNHHSWILDQKISSYGEHHLDYSVRYKTLKKVDREENCLFIFDKKPVYDTISEWKEMPPCWVFRETNVSCGSRAVLGHKDLKVVEKQESCLFVFDKEEIKR